MGMGMGMGGRPQMVSRRGGPVGMRMHVTGLPDNLLVLFQPRPPLEFVAPPKKSKPKLNYTGVAGYLEHFMDPKDDPVLSAPKKEPVLNLAQRKEKRRLDKKEGAAKVLAARLEEYKERQARLVKASQAEPKEGADNAGSADGDLTKDPYHTLFVGRLDYGATEDDLRQAFNPYGKIVSVKIVADATGEGDQKPRGYAFVEFSSSREMKEAYKDADGMKIKGRKCTVDVERGRTVEGWRPMRLGGGKGGESRRAKPGKRAGRNDIGGRLGPSPMGGRMGGRFGGDRDGGRDRGPGRFGGGWGGRGGGGGIGRDIIFRDRDRDRDREWDRKRPREDRERDRDRDRNRGRDRDRDEDRDRGRDRYRPRDRDDRDRDRDRDRDCDRDRDRGRDRYGDRGRDRDRGREYDRKRGPDRYGDRGRSPEMRKRRRPDDDVGGRPPLPHPKEREEGEL